MTSRSTGPIGALPGPTVHRLLGRALCDAFRHEGHEETDAASVRFTACALPAGGQAVGEGRRFSGSLLRDWALSPLVDNAALIVSELLSNALRYGLGALPARSAPGPAVWLGMLRRRGTVLFAVCDSSTAVPRVKEPDFMAQSGRGLHIIDCLSETWGWTTPDNDGKAVWAAVSCPAAPGVPDNSRADTRAVAAPWPVTAVRPFAIRRTV
ncbi:ATP-binding protein [Streptomyces sp. NPDC090052]|uniref:ATP-binding protein n=1 Tax=unclassified Streptomyces TaxID=2593676 RepID=UPI00224D38AD|nr:ATP-binding protein [Streptomyces sp. NBC_01306]MCX4724283.1 ATP-binding protein [Streptomyces sp. NBC_01306]WSX67673.1 ATP-binding protein [Streptomyces sp. NBC_00932]